MHITDVRKTNDVGFYLPRHTRAPTHVNTPAVCARARAHTHTFIVSVTFRFILKNFSITKQAKPDDQMESVHNVDISSF